MGFQPMPRARALKTSTNVRDVELLRFSRGEQGAISSTFRVLSPRAGAGSPCYFLRDFTVVNDRAPMNPISLTCHYFPANLLPCPSKLLNSPGKHPSIRQ